MTLAYAWQMRPRESSLPVPHGFLWFGAHDALSPRARQQLRGVFHRLTAAHEIPPGFVQMTIQRTASAHELHVRAELLPATQGDRLPLFVIGTFPPAGLDDRAALELVEALGGKLDDADNDSEGSKR